MGQGCWGIGELGEWGDGEMGGHIGAFPRIPGEHKEAVSKLAGEHKVHPYVHLGTLRRGESCIRPFRS